jgi:hypothetical protein
MHIAGRDVDWTTLLGIAAGVVGFVGMTVFGWEFGEGLSNPIAVGIGVVVAAVAVWVSYSRA